MGGSTIAEIVKDETNSAGAPILTVYAKVHKTYAIYRTEERVVIQFADDERLGRRQRRALAPLDSIKGEINGIIDGWRSSTSPDKEAKAKLFDRRVADALVVAFQGHVDCAKTILATIKRDLIEERVSWARFEYLLVASIAAVLLIAILSALTSGRYVSVYGFSAQVRTLWAAAAVGALGAFFSIAIAIRGRTVLTDLHSRDNAADAVLRIVIGAIAAGLLVCFVLSRVAVVTIGGTALEVGTGNSAWMVTVIAAFLAGFSERLVPDLLEKSALNAAGADNSTAPGGAPPQQPADSRSAAQAAAAPRTRMPATTRRSRRKRKMTWPRRRRRARLRMRRPSRSPPRTAKARRTGIRPPPAATCPADSSERPGRRLAGRAAREPRHQPGRRLPQSSIRAWACGAGGRDARRGAARRSCAAARRPGACFATDSWWTARSSTKTAAPGRISSISSSTGRPLPPRLQSTRWRMSNASSWATRLA